MNQLQLMESQFECGLFEIWSFGIIDSLVYRTICGLDDLPYSIDSSLSLEQRLIKFESKLDLPNLRVIKPELYEILLSKSGFLVRKNCADLCDPCDGLTFKSRFVDIVFLNVLREKKLLTLPTEYYYESILDVFPEITFDLTFFLDLLADQGWYKYASKFLSKLKDLEQVDIIKKDLPKSELHLNVLFVSWNIESTLNDDQSLAQFQTISQNLLAQSSCKPFVLRNNLAIYLALINVTLEELIGSISRQLARNFGLDKSHKTEDPVNPILPQVSISTSTIESVLRFLNDLGRNLFPNQELANVDNLKLCLKDPKSESIIEMIASIYELKSFINVLKKEVSLPELKFEAFDTIISGWDQWSQLVNMDERLCQEVLTLKRFFTLERVECRYLTCVIIKHGLPKYFDILESIDIELYLDPFVIFTFCDLIQTASRMETDVDLLEELVLILKRILTSIRSKKRITSLIKARSNFFGLYTLGDVKKTKLSALLRQQVGGVKYDQIRDEILLASFLAPYELLDFIVADAVEHAHQMIPFLAKLFCVELSGLMSSKCETKYDNTLLETIIGTRLSLVPTDNTIQGLLKLIKEIFLFYVNTKEPVQPLILSLERLMCHLAWDGCVDTKLTAFSKKSVYLLIQALSNQYDHIEWTYVQKEPASLIYSLVNMLDYYYEDGSKKTDYIELIAFVMNKKVRRKLTNREWNWMYNRMETVEEFTLLLAYLEPWLEERLSFYFDVRKMSLMNVITLASICKDNHWIYKLNRHYLDPNSANFSELIANILQFLCRSEWENLFNFLRNYGLIGDAMNAIVSGYADQDRNGSFNIDFITECMIDCLHSHYKAYLKDPEPYIPEMYEHLPNRIYLSEEVFLPILFRRFATCYMFKNKARNKRLDTFMLKLSKEMADKKINVNKRLFPKEGFNFAPEVILILRSYNKNCFYLPVDVKPTFRPI